jgi:hypothetical protein
MAWPGSDGRNAGKPGYDPFTAWRNTPLEEAAKDFLLARAHLSPGAKLWTFGAPRHADADEWTTERGTLAAEPGRVVLTPDPSGATVLVSPAELMLDGARAWRLVVLTDGAAPRALRVEGREARDAPWVALASTAGGEARLPPGRAGAIDAVRIELGFGAPGPAALVRVAILPDRDTEQR